MTTSTNADQRECPGGDLAVGVAQAHGGVDTLFTLSGAHAYPMYGSASAYASDVPYLVNVIPDPEAAYPRTTTGV